MRTASAVVLVVLLVAGCSSGSAHVPTLADALRHQPAGLVTFPAEGNGGFTIGRWDTGPGCDPPSTASLTGLGVENETTFWRQPIPWSPQGDDVVGGMVLGAAAQVGVVPATVWAADARSGRPRWQRFFASQVVSILGVSGGRLLVTTGADIVALDIATGAVAWLQPAVAASGPLGVEGVPDVFDVLEGSSIVGIDPASGQQLYRVFGPDGYVSGVAETSGSEADEILVGVTGKTVLGLDPDTGARRWVTGLPFDATFDRVDDLVDEPGLVVVVLGSGLGPDHRIVVLSPATGAVAWTVDGVGNLRLAGDIVMIDRRRFPAVPSGDTLTVIAREAATGAELWSAPTGAPLGGFIGTLDHHAVFYVQTRNGPGLIVLNPATGVTSQGARPSELPAVPTTGQAPPGLLQVGGATIVWTGDEIANIDLASAATAWQVHPAQPLLGTLAAIGNLIIADSGTPARYCI